LFARLAVGETVTVAGYDAWQWNGFTRSAWVPIVSASPLNSTASVNSTASTLGNGTASLSGAVYCDQDGNGIRDTSDWGIAGASVSLSLVGSSDPLSVAVTDWNGLYTFSGLAAGDYVVTLLTPSSQPEQPVVGQLGDASYNIVTTGTGSASGLDSITDLQLGNGYTAVNYDFPQLAYPTELISKRMLLNVDPGVAHTGMPSPVPEPGSLALFIIAGLLLGELSRRRRR
jgi:hypothetical protein